LVSVRRVQPPRARQILHHVAERLVDYDFVIARAAIDSAREHLADFGDDVVVPY